MLVGLSYNGFDENGEVKWDGVSNFKLRVFVFGPFYQVCTSFICLVYSCIRNCELRVRGDWFCECRDTVINNGSKQFNIFVSVNVVCKLSVIVYFGINGDLKQNTWDEILSGHFPHCCFYHN